MHLLWDVRVSLDLFLGGIGIGAFLLGTLLYFLDSTTYDGLIKRAFITAPIAVITGLLLLMSELGRPFNVFKTLYAVNPTSFMSLGIFLQSAFVILSLILAFWVVTKGAEALSGKLIYFSAVLAGLVGFYHGFLLTGINIEPWNSALPVIFFISSLLAGVSLVLLINPGQLDKVSTKLKLPVILNLILTLELAAIIAWVYNLALSTEFSRHAYEVLMNSFGLEFWGLTILVGLIVPIGLFTLVLLNKLPLKSVFLPACIAMVAGSFFLKNLVVYLGQAI
jgi:protein NrfD